MAENNISKNSLTDPQKVGFSTPNVPTTKKIKPKINNKNNTGIPNKVANRMARRVAIFTGIPTISGMGVFVGSYVLISRGIAEISPTLTLVTSAGCFLIGLIGLSYGILSASWDEAKGSLLGLENIKTNISRVKAAFYASKNST